MGWNLFVLRCLTMFWSRMIGGGGGGGPWPGESEGASFHLGHKRHFGVDILASVNGNVMCPFKLTFNTRSRKRIKSFSHCVQRNALSISSHNEEIFVFTLKSVGDAKFSPKYAMMVEIWKVELVPALTALLYYWLSCSPTVSWLRRN